MTETPRQVPLATFLIIYPSLAFVNSHCSSSSGELRRGVSSSGITNRPVFVGIVLQCHDATTFARNEVDAVFSVATNLVPTIADDVILEVFVCKVEERLFILACFAKDVDPVFPPLLAVREPVDMVIDKF